MSEEFYDNEIAPELLKLANKCREKGISFLAVVEYEPNERGKTLAVQSDAGIEMVMLNHCAKMGANIDGYAMGLLRYAQDNGIDYSQSMVMKMLTGEWP